MTCPYYPISKSELWWVLIADDKQNKLYASQRVSKPFVRGGGGTEVVSKFSSEGVDTTQETGSLKVYLVCDSYVGCDLDEDVKFS